MLVSLTITFDFLNSDSLNLKQEVKKLQTVALETADFMTICMDDVDIGKVRVEVESKYNIKPIISL